MKVFYKISVMIVLLVFVIGFLFGCNSPPSEKPTALIIIAGNHANNRECSLSFDNEIRNVYSKFGNVNVIIIDGNPTVVTEENGEILGFCDKQYIVESKKVYQDSNLYWINNYLEPLVMKVSNAVKESCADDPEVDTLKALQVAKKQLNYLAISMETEIEMKIIIWDSGLSTTGDFNFLDGDNNILLGSQNRLWEDEEGKAAVKSLVEGLKANEAIPDLSGVTVTWYGLGAVGGEQEELNNLTIQNLQYIWGEILTAAGVKGQQEPEKNGSNDRYGMFFNINFGDSIECYQKVSKVVIKMPTPTPTPEPTPEPIPDIPGDVFFKEDSYVFREDINPEIFLQSWADYINLYPDINFLLVGTVADPSKNGGNVQLSLDRANAVKGVLVNKLGIVADRLTTVGVGAQSPWYNENEWQNGKFLTNSEAAKSNRAVRILPIDSDLAQDILNRNYS